MDKQDLPIKFADCVEFTIPAFEGRPPVTLSFTQISGAEGRIIDAKSVNPAIYSDLEYVYNEGYREARKNLSVVGYELLKADKTIRMLKSTYLLDEYPDFLKEKKLKDNAANRDAFLSRQEDYELALDRIAMLKALESLLEGKVKVFENVCRYMKKAMDLTIRSGVDSNKYTGR